MSLKKALLSKVLGLALGLLVSASSYAVDATSDASAEALVPKESMFQAGRSKLKS